jgi:hypothetical protein
VEEIIERLKEAETIMGVCKIVNEQDSETRKDTAFVSAVFAATERIIGK